MIDAGVRDLDAERDELSVGPRRSQLRTRSRNPGQCDTPLVCAGALVHPGDLIIADDDGVVVVRQDEASGFWINTVKAGQ